MFQKFLVVALVAAFSGSAFAASPSKSPNGMKPLKRATSPALQAFYAAASKAAGSENNSGQGTVSMAYSIEKSEPKSGETKFDTLERLVKFALHHDFPITGDDGGYGFSRLGKNETEKSVERSLKDMTWLVGDDGAVSAEQLAPVLVNAAAKGLLVLVGGGTGNNTMADIVAVADPKNMEFVVLLNSNFGSDD